MKILQAGPVPSLLAKRLPEFGELTALKRLMEDEDDRAMLAKRGAEFPVLVTSGTLGADAATMDALPSLRAILSYGVGYDAIDIEAANARGIQVANTPEVLNDCVADLAMGLVIDVARRLTAADRFVRRGDWPVRGAVAPAVRVSGKRLGLLGIGRIGQTIAKRARGFDMQIRYHSRRARPELEWPHEATLEGLADWCDFLVVACTGGAATRHLVDAQVLKALGPKGFLVNIARGSVVDETALVECLQQKGIAGAGLDVFEDEPRVPDALKSMDQVVLLPHIGSSSVETRTAMAELVLDNLRAFIANGQVLNRVVE